MSEIPPSGTFKVLSLAKKLEREGRDIIHLEVGQPDFDTPDHIKKAAEKALAEGVTKYTPSAGTPELREAIVESVGAKGIKVLPDEVLVAPGSKHAIFCAMAAALDPGDEVLIPSPCWTYEGIVRVAGGKPVFVETTQADGFKLKTDKLQEKLTPKTRMLLLNYPNNPAGAVMGEKELRAIADLVSDRALWVLTDEIYDCLVYESRHVSIVSMPGMRDRTIYINGFSKTYAMTGWRLGYSIAPAELVEAMVKIQQASTTCAASFVQAAGLAALKGPQDCVRCMIEEYRKRRDVIVEGLNSIDGFECVKPEGAFYVFPRIEKLGMNSEELCKRLLRETGVAAVPGSAFGPYGEGHIRFSYANSEENIRRAIDRMKEMEL